MTVFIVKPVHMNTVTLSVIEQKQVQHAAELLEKNIQFPLTIPELAASTQLSESKLKKLFKQFYGIPLYRYLLTFRMKKAQSLLLKDTPIKVISQTVGYRTESNFCKAFRKELGESPKKWLINKKQARRTA